ncbi:aminotransferase class V-fold PLP-dependent enzyme, partial [Treponema sp. R6D11]
MIYLDNAATGLLDAEMMEKYKAYADEFWYNASSLYAPAYNAKKELEKTRQDVLRLLGKKSGRVIFTSGGTESNNLAILGWFDANKRAKNNRVITSYLEHPSSRLTAEATENFAYADVNSSGEFVLESMKKHDDIGFVSCMAVNNEIGSIQPVEEIAQYCAHNGIVFHCDFV